MYAEQHASADGATVRGRDIRWGRWFDMTLDQFQIGQAFFILTKNGYAEWMCTDKGTRTIAAVCIEDHKDDPSWFTGPPYAVKEYVIDEDTMNVCEMSNARSQPERSDRLDDDVGNPNQ
jgi:hypothetical protein